MLVDDHKVRIFKVVLASYLRSRFFISKILGQLWIMRPLAVGKEKPCLEISDYHRHAERREGPNHFQALRK